MCVCLIIVKGQDSLVSESKGAFYIETGGDISLQNDKVDFNPYGNEVWIKYRSKKSWLYGVSSNSFSLYGSDVGLSFGKRWNQVSFELLGKFNFNNARSRYTNSSLIFDPVSRTNDSLNVVMNDLGTVERTQLYNVPRFVADYSLRLLYYQKIWGISFYGGASVSYIGNSYGSIRRDKIYLNDFEARELQNDILMERNWEEMYFSSPSISESSQSSGALKLALEAGFILEIGDFKSRKPSRWEYLDSLSHKKDFAFGLYSSPYGGFFSVEKEVFNNSFLLVGYNVPQSHSSIFQYSQEGYSVSSQDVIYGAQFYRKNDVITSGLNFGWRKEFNLWSHRIHVGPYFVTSYIKPSIKETNVISGQTPQIEVEGYFEEDLSSFGTGVLYEYDAAENPVLLLSGGVRFSFNVLQCLKFHFIGFGYSYSSGSIATKTTSIYLNRFEYYDSKLDGVSLAQNLEDIMEDPDHVKKSSMYRNGKSLMVGVTLSIPGLMRLPKHFNYQLDVIDNMFDSDKND